jgi:hypothetical protein
MRGSLYGVVRETDELVKLGSGATTEDGNFMIIRFFEQALARFATELRPLMLLGPNLKSWPAEAMAVSKDAPDEIKIWANPRGKRKDHRPQIWRGKVLSDELAVLLPTVDVAKLDGFERVQDGFLRQLRNG